jgi:hypothetical protein
MEWYMWGRGWVQRLWQEWWLSCLSYCCYDQSNIGRAIDSLVLSVLVALPKMFLQPGSKYIFPILSGNIPEILTDSLSAAEVEVDNS